MSHVFYSDGNAEKISWAIQTGGSLEEQTREHARDYRDKISTLQSKYIALHVGLFWGIGAFIFRDNDSIMIRLDEKAMYDHLTSDTAVRDSLIAKRIRFIRQIIAQRKFDVKFELISRGKNIAKIG